MKYKASDVTIAENHFPFGYFVAVPAENSIYIHAGWSIDEGQWIPGGGSLFKGEGGWKRAKKLFEEILKAPDKHSLSS